MLAPQSIKRLISRHAVTLGFFASAIIAWPILAEYELFERFYEFSRVHEDWEIDELVPLVGNLVVALILSVVFQSRRLRTLIKEREFQRARAERNARHDPLTGLMNRRAFTSEVKRIESDSARQDGTRIMAVVDLDRFKPINDLYGHAAGDATLQEAARRLRAQIEPDGQVARLGGDEFAIIFGAKQTVAEAERAARRILHAMEAPVVFEGTSIFAGVSIGLAQWTTDIRSAEALRRADKALYNAKDLGRAQFAWYDCELDRKSHERAEIEADLRHAIAEDHVNPWFQPIIEIGTHKLTGFEVLARWTHPTKGSISPTDFIEIAEDSGQIGALGMSLLRQACTASRGWDPRLTISFNISPYQFHDPKLVDTIRDILTDCDFQPSRLTIEITESSVIHDFDTANAKLAQLKSLGIAVALDDFGTGYSSLSSLRRLPFDRIKIDRSFVTNIALEPQNQKIVTGIMALAHGLDLNVTAEGIETTEDLEYLQAMNCSLGQGFLFERALPARDVNWLLESSWSDGVVDPGMQFENSGAPARARS